MNICIYKQNIPLALHSLLVPFVQMRAKTITDLCFMNLNEIVNSYSRDLFYFFLFCSKGNLCHVLE